MTTFITPGPNVAWAAYALIDIDDLKKLHSRTKDLYRSEALRGIATYLRELYRIDSPSSRRAGTVPVLAIELPAGRIMISRPVGSLAERSLAPGTTTVESYHGRVWLIVGLSAAPAMAELDRDTQLQELMARTEKLGDLRSAKNS